MDQAYETLRLDRPQEGVLRVVLNRPGVANAFNTAMATDLMTFFEAVALAPDMARVIVVTGAGERAFCAGGDLKERDGMSDAAWAAQHLIFERMVRAIIGCPVPTIAAVNGAAFAGGCELAAAMDMIYAAEHAVFAQTEVRIGIIPGAGGTQTVARAIGTRRAKEMILSARRVSAAEAEAWGLVNRVVPGDALMGEVLTLAGEIAAQAPIAVRQAKLAIGRGEGMSLSDGLALEIEAYNRTFPTEDRREGVRAFNEKRAPVFRGR